MLRSKHLKWFAPALLWGALAAACGSDSGDDRGAGAGAPGPGAGQGGGAGDGAGSGDDFGNSDASVLARDGGPPPGMDMSAPDGGCAASSEEAEQVVIEETITTEQTVETVAPVALYLVLDQSQSMDNEGLWTPAKDAIKSFINDPSSEGIDVALEFFPDVDPFVAIDCTGTGYDVPTVPMGRLSGHAANIATALDARPSAGQIGTPIEAALRGGTQYCQQFEADHPDEKCVVVLVTDGAPFGCVGDTATLAGIAGAAYNGGSGIRTFAVGLMGADFTLLDEIARMGGAVDCAEQDDTRFSCDVSGGPDQLSDALSKIREVVTTVETKTEVITMVEEKPLPCEWEIPAPPPGEVFDRDKVNVQLSGSEGGETSLGAVSSPEQCAALGWHYDEADDPTRIVACPETCTTLQSTAGARIDILLGCATIPLE